MSEWPPTGSARPYTRWWWLRGPFREEDLGPQLEWLERNGFGGVEIAWLAPLWAEDDPASRPAWLGPEWTRIVARAKREADRLGLGCDFTFGSVWPFGGTCVPEELSSGTLDGPSRQRLRASWEEPARGLVLDHLDARALDHYFACLGPAFAPALGGSKSALFCDSLEIEPERVWSPRLWDEFEARCGYSLRDHAAPCEEDAGVRYDHRKVVGEAIVREFYAAFAERCHRLGALARVQCHGAPADLLAAYATADVPESEALLFPPAFSRIAASAAALADRPVVSCETFTCIYGFPRSGDAEAVWRAWKRERVEDLKLLADAVLANGVNQIVWHGTPYNPPGGRNEFYASVHVGPDSPLAPHLRAFNGYLTAASAAMQRGRTCARLAIYLPTEDMILAGPIPEAERTPGAGHRSEMRTVRVPPGTEGFAPVWISRPFLATAEVRDGALVSGPLRVEGLVVDVEWLDDESLAEILRLARAGMPTVLLRRPRCPGRLARSGYDDRLAELAALPCVVSRLDELPAQPLVEGEDLPWYWARETTDEVTVFFAHPAARDIRYPMKLGSGAAAGAVSRTVRIRAFGTTRDVRLDFVPCGSVLLRVRADGIREEPLPAWRAEEAPGESQTGG